MARILGVAAIAAVSQVAVLTPVLAEDASECVCVVDSGSVGRVTSASGWVKLNGKVGLVDATEDAPISVGSVLRTGVAGSASASIDDCSVDLAALSELSISSLENGKLCVRLSQDPEPVPVTTGVVAAGGAVLAGGAIVVGLGQDKPVSQ